MPCCFGVGISVGSVSLAGATGVRSVSYASVARCSDVVVVFGSVSSRSAGSIRSLAGSPTAVYDVTYGVAVFGYFCANRVTGLSLSSSHVGPLRWKSTAKYTVYY